MSYEYLKVSAGGPGSRRHQGGQWQNTPDKFETGNAKYDVVTVSIKSISQAGGWTVTKTRNRYARLMKEETKFPLILVNTKNEIEDGQHRYEAYQKAFPAASQITIAKLRPKIKSS